MNNRQKRLKYLAECAIIAALYAAATYLSAVIGLAYGPIQFRISEALCILSVFTPAAIPGLTIGCVIGNLTSPMGIWDIVFGAAATFFAALCGRLLRNIRIKDIPLLSAIMPVIFNAVIVGAEITFLLPSASGETGITAFAIAALEVGLGELVVCVLLGLPLYKALKKTKLFSNKV
ncbi:MAG: QueT transporter family protein [Clostridia bacterium]|nr:QueT transporter family protein [Clostridia bacterium]